MFTKEDRNNLQLGSFIRLMRRQKLLSQREMAEYLNLSVMTIGRIENGERAVSVNELLMIAALFQIEVMSILNGAVLEDYKEELGTALVT